ncbi:hypothetical protein L218DRAFT_93212 [Marasmius fiardii PR-910]|nr:hypothetical protein L218DRAFT_93212 [Marasmius fiardii PR-910]
MLLDPPRSCGTSSSSSLLRLYFALLPTTRVACRSRLSGLVVVKIRLAPSVAMSLVAGSSSRFLPSISPARTWCRLRSQPDKICQRIACCGVQELVGADSSSADFAYNNVRGSSHGCNEFFVSAMHRSISHGKNLVIGCEIPKELETAAS